MAVALLAHSLDMGIRVGIGLVCAALIVLGLRLVGRILSRKSESYRLSAQRLDLEHGIFGKKYEAIELWRIKDVVLEQGLIDRLLGNGRLTIYSTDQVEPLLQLGPLRDAKPVYERLRDAMVQARKDQRVMQVQN